MKKKQESIDLTSENLDKPIKKKLKIKVFV